MATPNQDRKGAAAVAPLQSDGSSSRSRSSCGDDIEGPSPSLCVATPDMISNAKEHLSELELHFDAQCRWPEPLSCSPDQEPSTMDPTTCDGGLEHSRFSGSPTIAPFFAALNELVFAEALLPEFAKKLLPTSTLQHPQPPSTPPPPPPPRLSVGCTGGKVRTPTSPRRPPLRSSSQSAEGAFAATDVGAVTDVVSFSHFLPDPRLYATGRRDLKHVMGSPSLALQVQNLKPKVHVFGHSHLRFDQALSFPATTKSHGGGGSVHSIDPPSSSSPSLPPSSPSTPPPSIAPTTTRFVQSCLGYPQERRHRATRPHLLSASILGQQQQQSKEATKYLKVVWP